MSILSMLRDLLLGEQPRVLRNKPHGMAWVRGVPTGTGSEFLNNSAVKTMRINERGTWTIEPTLYFIASTDFTAASGNRYRRGDLVGVSGIEDCFLEPWKDTGLRQEDVNELFAPNAKEGQSA